MCQNVVKAQYSTHTLPKPFFFLLECTSYAYLKSRFKTKKYSACTVEGRVNYYSFSICCEGQFYIYLENNKWNNTHTRTIFLIFFQK